MLKIFDNWFKRIMAYEDGSRFHFHGNVDALYGEAAHLLWAMRFLDSRGEQRMQRKVNSDSHKASSNPNKQCKYDKKFFSDVDSLNKKLKTLITHADKFDADILQVTLMKEEDYDKESEAIIKNLEESKFPIENLKKLRDINKERKEDFRDFMRIQQNHINTIIKINKGTTDLSRKQINNAKLASKR